MSKDIHILELAAYEQPTITESKREDWVEFGDDNNPAWVHVSYVSEDESRHRCLKAYKENGKTKYKVI